MNQNEIVIVILIEGDTRHMFTRTTRSAAETAQLAQMVGKKIHEGTVVCLDGDLGAGKTLFVQNVVKMLGIEEGVTSPTFNLMNVYEGFCRVYHFDLYRLETAEELYKLGVPLIPRMMTELAHSETGIDIHPEATIGKHFTIDHGTGVVIGATCIIGDNVKLYQGVTLGAKSFPLDKNGNPIKGIPRHPILQDDVIVYANATILGRITIGKGCVVGANVWVTKDMQPKTKKYKKEKQSLLDIEFNNGTGI